MSTSPLPPTVVYQTNPPTTEAALRSLTAERDALRLSVVEHKTDRATLEAEHRKMQDERDMATARLAELLDAKMEYPCHYGKQHKPEDKCIYCERDAARAELESLKRLNEQTRHEGIKLAGELTRAAAERAESDRAANKAETECAYLRARVAELEHQIDRLRDIADTKDIACEQASNRVALLEGLVRELRGHLYAPATVLFRDRIDAALAGGEVES